MQSLQKRLIEACELALQYGMIDGAHHKQWVIDQMLRLILDEDYQDMIDKYNSDDKYSNWDEGIPP